MLQHRCVGQNFLKIVLLFDLQPTIEHIEKYILPVLCYICYQHSINIYICTVSIIDDNVFTIVSENPLKVFTNPFQQKKPSGEVFVADSGQITRDGSHYSELRLGSQLSNMACRSSWNQTFPCRSPYQKVWLYLNQHLTDSLLRDLFCDTLLKT